MGDVAERLYPWGDTRRYHSYAAYARRTFGRPVRKIAVDGGFTCPNRDGKIAYEGCAFCDNGAFTPSYCSPGLSITAQIDAGIRFASRHIGPDTLLLAYFQPFNNTYAPLETLRARFGEALAHPRIGGLIVGTRPDCVDPRTLDYLAELSRTTHVTVEYGVESVRDATLRAVNRGHDFAAARRAICLTAQRGIRTGAHFILGLPGEDDDMLIGQTAIINELPVHAVKFHQLQLLRGTPLSRRYDADPEAFGLRSPDRYVELTVEILRRLRSDIVVERLAANAPEPYRHAGSWGLRGCGSLVAAVEKKLAERRVFQGEIFIPLQR